jgi:two-component system phosphate regulon sensor histidine kinase PhoR
VRNAQLFNRLQAQQRQLETVLQAIPDVLLVLDERGHILLINDAANEFLGDTDPILVIGRHLGDFADTALAPILETLQSSTTHEDKQWLFEVRSEKRKKDLQITLSVWRDATNGFAGYVVAMHDVTMLRDLNRFKDEMLRVASHDLRSPLSLIVGYADLINLDIDPASPAAEYLSVIRRSTERMNGLLDDLLRVEQARRSPLELNEEVDLGALAVEAVDDSQPLAEHKNQQLTAELRTEGLPGVVADPVLISRAMNNLISNAIKYTPEFGHIHVKAYAENHRFHFVVEDNGIGITPENLTRVFESFFRIKDERAGDVAGSGLGLSFVKTIIERHNGDVWVESELGSGSKFGFWLPLNRQ